MSGIRPWRRPARLILTVLILCGGTAVARAGVRDQHPNLIGGELGGRGLVLTLNYERFVNNSFGLGGGIMAVGASGSVAVVMPLYLSIVPGDVHSPYFSVGATMLGEGGRLHDYEDLWLGQASLGYQFQSRGGFFVRPLFTYLSPLSSEDRGFLIWPGLTIGGSF
jgi:hypothetical protein